MTARANTVVGDLPSGAYGFRIGTEGANPPVSGFSITNNVFADPTGSMGNRLINSYGQVVTSSISLDNNLYFNGGTALPNQGSVTPADDGNAIVADPLLATDHANITLPECVAAIRWRVGVVPGITPEPKTRVQAPLAGSDGRWSRQAARQTC